MRIEIRQEDSRPINIRFPSRFLTSRAGIRILISQAVKRGGQDKRAALTGFSREQAHGLAEAFGIIRRKYGSFTLVEVEADDGTEVRITI